jgi:hypothetical protein
MFVRNERAKYSAAGKYATVPRNDVDRRPS